MSALIRWLPKLAVATADDIRRFGPNAAQVRSLLDFMPTMSDDAIRVGADAWESARGSGRLGPAFQELQDAVQRADWNNDFAPVDEYAGRLRNAITQVQARNLGNSPLARKNPWLFANAAEAEVASNLIPEEVYKTIVEPLAAGRAVDVLRARPRLQDTPFLNVVRGMSERGAISRPRDVVIGSRLAQSPEAIREIAITLMGEGMTAEEAINAARLLA